MMAAGEKSVRLRLISLSSTCSGTPEGAERDRQSRGETARARKRYGEERENKEQTHDRKKSAV